ncbi:tyrosine-type recombinase/integrase [Hwangdonia seohaensis]|uniref:Tyrosine-type recombinase/integrase n=1 Tax=Hwangdonia seohaensis TaxID=1240727 RepID=A0ABW3RD45_9FLAO|nr:site-specific integrase [Hwangdonia seohaensis]
MQSIYNFITFDVENEHDLEHDLEHKTLFSTPKIYDADGDLSKRWYVYFSFVNPKTGKLKRMKNIYGKTNRYKTKESRYFLLRLYRKRLLKLLQQGYNPFEDNTWLLEKYSGQSTENAIEKPKNTNNEVKAVKMSEETSVLEDGKQKLTPKEALEYALRLKTNVVGERTLVDYKSRCELFEKWLTEHSKETETIDKVGKKLVSGFLNDVQLRTSPRNRNNYRTCLSSIFQVLEDNDIIDKNFVKSINTLKTNPKRNKTYTEKQHQDIFEYLEEKDPLLLLYIKFVSYNFLRPIEVCRLRVKDIDLNSKTLQFKAKNKTLKTKLIPDLLLKELKDLSDMDGSLFLFTPDGIGGNWEATLGSRSGYFSKRFRKVVKEHFGLDKNYGLYSFRHTFITKLYRSLVEETSPFAAKSVLMQITGHATMSSLEKYLRDIDAELPKDYSIYLK